MNWLMNFEKNDSNQNSFFKSSEELLKVITGQSIVGIALVQNNIIKYVNEAISILLEIPIQELLGQRLEIFYKHVHQEDRSFALEQVEKKQIGAPDAVIQYSSRIISKSGKIKWVELYSKTILYLGKPADFITAIDITEKKKSEQKLIKSERNYQDAYDRANFYKDLFAHDINNILQNVLSAAEICFLNLDQPEKVNNIKETLNIIKDQVKRGANLVSNVRKLSQLEEKKVLVEKIEVNENIVHAIEFTRNSFSEKKIDIKTENFNKKFHVYANELLLDVFENVLINAVKHNDNLTAKIVIKFSSELRQGKKFLKMEFIDNGMGISDDRKELIFQRQDKNCKKVSGMGLGLSLVKKVVESYEGHIWVEDKVKGDRSKGSNFIILIPEVI